MPAIPRHGDEAFAPRRRSHPDLELRLRARALALALRRELTATQAAEVLAAMAGATPAAPIAVRRALSRLETAYGHRPSALTAKAVEALRLTLRRFPAAAAPSAPPLPPRVRRA